MNAVFETEAQEIELARLVCFYGARKFFFSESYFRKDTWEVYFKWMTTSKCMGHLAILNYGKNQEFLEPLVRSLPRMSLKILYMFQVDIMDFGDRLLKSICDTLERLTIKKCSGFDGGCPSISIHSVVGEGRGRKYKLLDLDVRCRETIVDSLPNLLLECNQLRQLTISRWSPPVSRLVWGPSFNELAVSIWAHTCLKNIFCVDEFNSVVHQLMDDRRRPIWQSGIAFMSVHIKRVSSRSAMSKLFLDADRLIWKCLI